MDRPRLLLMPEFTELEWEVIRPRLEEWAEVASFDPPGVGEEPPLKKLDRQVVADRGLEELDRLEWNECFVATDSWSIPSAVRVAIARPQTVIGMALGHAKLSYRRKGERAPVNGPVYDAMVELIRTRCCSANTSVVLEAPRRDSTMRQRRFPTPGLSRSSSRQ